MSCTCTFGQAAAGNGLSGTVLQDDRGKPGPRGLVTATDQAAKAGVVERGPGLGTAAGRDRLRSLSDLGRFYCGGGRTAQMSPISRYVGTLCASKSWPFVLALPLASLRTPKSDRLLALPAFPSGMFFLYPVPFFKVYPAL